MSRAVPILLDVQHVSQRYALPRPSVFAKAGHIQALDNVSFQLMAGKSMGVVGESGSGKSTLARLVMALEKPTQGQVIFKGQDLNALPQAHLQTARSDFQMVFQDPYGSLDPRQKVLRIVAEPLHSQLHGVSDLKDLAAQALSEVGLRPSDLDKYPHEFSGGQRQRIAIARALITRPALIVADEPVSALDVSVQAQVLNLMMDLQDRFGLSYLFVSHDLAVINLMCDDVIVLQHGQVVEAGSADDIFQSPQHPYTQTLLSAIPGLSQ
ncbi:MAG: ATP-binding cassette domain-containing protein [Burkholderiales bacterium]|nr:ATP-binding cassette domain-containing protein [Burkholderiales bacterium]